MSSLLSCVVFVLWVQVGSADLRRMAPALHEPEARASFARMAGLRLGAVSNRALSGVTVPSARISQLIYGDLQAWCEQSGWTVSEDHVQAIYILRKKGQTVTIPLGAAVVNCGPRVAHLPTAREIAPRFSLGVRKIVTYNHWTDIVDVVVIKDGRIMVPSGVLDDLAQLQNPPTRARRLPIHF